MSAPRYCAMAYALQPIACSDQKSRSRFFLRVVTLLMVGTGLSSPACSLSTPRVRAQHFVAASARLIATLAPSDLPVPCNRVAHSGVVSTRALARFPAIDDTAARRTEDAARCVEATRTQQ